jgi:AraC family transcriptional regulator of adaptative response / DNA-3-methyladenine glycosylase II
VRAVPGVEVVTDGHYARTLRLPHGPGTVRLRLPDVAEAGTTAYAQAEFVLTDLRDLGAATERTRRLLDADCDPVAVEAAFADDPVLGPGVRTAPGLRVPGHVDGHEIAVRAVLGQQVSVAAARTLAARLTAAVDDTVETGIDGLSHLFPSAEQVAAREPGEFAMPAARARALLGLSAAAADGVVDLDRGADRGEVRERLLALPGIGPWTADYVAMRALGDPDCFLPTDTGTRQALVRAGQDPGRAAEAAEAWRPWRSYAQVRLWHSLTSTNEEERV